MILKHGSVLVKYMKIMMGPCHFLFCDRRHNPANVKLLPYKKFFYQLNLQGWEQMKQRVFKLLNNFSCGFVSMMP